MPLSDEAVKEARELMLATQNLLKPSSGDPIVGPSKDTVMGVYYLTVDENEAAETDKLPAFSNMEEAEYAYDMGIIKLRQPIRVLYTSKFDELSIDDLEVSDRVLEALKAFGIVSVGQLMDHYTHGERKMIADIPAFGAAAMDETREALRLLGLLGLSLIHISEPTRPY